MKQTKKYPLMTCRALSDYIYDNFNSQIDFAKHAGVAKQQITKWSNNEFFVATLPDGDWLCSKRRKLDSRSIYVNEKVGFNSETDSNI